jgi:hypothetical protein
LAHGILVLLVLLEVSFAQVIQEIEILWCYGRRIGLLVSPILGGYAELLRSLAALLYEEVQRRRVLDASLLVLIVAGDKM